MCNTYGLAERYNASGNKLLTLDFEIGLPVYSEVWRRNSLKHRHPGLGRE
jgi:hypothetical protein